VPVVLLHCPGEILEARDPVTAPLAAFVTLKRIRLIDACDVLRPHGRPGAREPYSHLYFTDGHYNVEGHRVLGQGLAAYFAREQLLGR